MRLFELAYCCRLCNRGGHDVALARFLESEPMVGVPKAIPCIPARPHPSEPFALLYVGIAPKDAGAGPTPCSNRDYAGSTSEAT